MTELVTRLEKAYTDFHSGFYREKDPVRFSHQYTNARDIEVTAFLSALLSYGNVKIILANLSSLLEALGPSPYKAITTQELPKSLGSFRHRFTNHEDLRVVIYVLGELYKEHKKLESHFTGASVKESLTQVANRFLTTSLPKDLEKIRQKRLTSLKHLVPSPQRGSACKRLCLFLRWMVRDGK